MSSESQRGQTSAFLLYKSSGSSIRESETLPALVRWCTKLDRTDPHDPPEGPVGAQLQLFSSTSTPSKAQWPYFTDGRSASQTSTGPVGSRWASPELVPPSPPVSLKGTGGKSRWWCLKAHVMKGKRHLYSVLFVVKIYK